VLRVISVVNLWWFAWLIFDDEKYANFLNYFF
jgi:hypothetical protein